MKKILQRIQLSFRFMVCIRVVLSNPTPTRKHRFGVTNHFAYSKISCANFYKNTISRLRFSVLNVANLPATGQEQWYLKSNALSICFYDLCIL